MMGVHLIWILRQNPIDVSVKVIEARLKQQQQQPAITTVHSEEPSSAAEVSSDVLSADMDNSGSLGRPPAKLVRGSMSRRNVETHMIF